MAHQSVLQNNFYLMILAKNRFFLRKINELAWDVAHPWVRDISSNLRDIRAKVIPRAKSDIYPHHTAAFARKWRKLLGTSLGSCNGFALMKLKNCFLCRRISPIVSLLVMTYFSEVPGTSTSDPSSWVFCAASIAVAMAWM